MSEHDRDEIKRAALLRHIGITSVAALAGVVAVEDDAGAQQHPFDLVILSGSGKKHRLPPPTPSPSETPPPVRRVQWVMLVSDPREAPPGSTVYEVPSPYISGTDELNTDHGGDGTSKMLVNPVYLVLGPRFP